LPPAQAPGFCRGALGHDASALCQSDLLAEIRLATLAEFALVALRDVEGNDMVAGLEVGHSLADALHDAGALMAQDHGEQALRIGTTQGEGIRVANSSGGDLNANLLGKLGNLTLSSLSLSGVDFSTHIFIYVPHVLWVVPPRCPQ